MELQEEVYIPLPRSVVFKALNDPEILQQSIPGCEEIQQLSETELEATVVVKFGPVKASFLSAVTVDPSQGPEKFNLSGKGDAGVVGFANGDAAVTLADQDGGTVLAYQVKIDVAGKLAQVGNRLIEGTSKRLARQFFVNFEQSLQKRELRE